MTRFALAFILSLLVLTAPAWAAPDLAKIGESADAAAAELAGAHAETAALKSQRGTLEKVLLVAAEISEKKDATISWQADEIAKRDQWLVDARSWKWTLLSGFPGALGCLFLLAGTAGFVLDVGRTAAKCLVIAVPLMAGSAGLIFYGPEYAWIGIGIGGVLSLGGLAWIVYDVRQTQDAAIELADGQQQVENAGILGDVAKGRSVFDQARGKLAAKLFKKATA